MDHNSLNTGLSSSEPEATIKRQYNKPTLISLINHDISGKVHTTTHEISTQPTARGPTS